MLGSYDPHAKTTTLVKEKAEYYLAHGAQPSDRVVRLFESEGITLPTWLKKRTEKKHAIRHADKLRRNQPKEAVVEVEATSEEPAEQ
jgi:ribosomal protein S16